MFVNSNEVFLIQPTKLNTPMFVLQPKLTHKHFCNPSLFVMNFKAYLNATKLKKNCWK